MRTIPLIIAILIASQLNAQQTVGLFSNTGGAWEGYTLFSPLVSKNTYLIDNCGYQIHSWASDYTPGNSVYLLEDGTLLRTGNTNNKTFTGSGGQGGIIERMDWDGTVLWSYVIDDNTQLQHHDIEYLPNGNILAIVWEKRSTTEAIAAGRDTSLLAASVWSEKIVEIAPTDTHGGSIVWEWKAWDHLVQDYDTGKANYGTVAGHPELIDLNYVEGEAKEDWLHINSIDYNAELDQVMVSVHNFNEVWVIDHNTTSAEAASHSGGGQGKGGDLLYRWGNPQAYGQGASSDQLFYAQHDARWIEHGDDKDKIMVYNNGVKRSTQSYSSVDVFDPPVDANGAYTLQSGQAYGPASLDWTYTASTPTDFYSMSISGAERLPNGNTLICEGESGHFFEVDADGNSLWDYVNPVTMSGPVEQGYSVAGQGPSGNPIPVFRCKRYNTEYAAFDGKTLTPGDPIEANPLDYDCTMLADTTGNDSTTALQGLFVPKGFSLYPNPAREVVFLEPAEEIERVDVYDQHRLVRSLSPHRQGSISLSGLKPGAYYLRIYTNKGTITRKLFIIR